jgi:hypothetical protein
MILSTVADRFRTGLVRGGSSAAFVLASLVSRDVLAQGGDRAAADALFYEARDLVRAGKRAEGCAKFEASLALSPAASTMLNIARCHEQDGKIATAWADYTRALSLNGDTPGVERRRELEGLARKGLHALEPRLPRLRIVVASAPPGVEVWRDDKAIPAAALGEALPADPGLHQVRVRAPGYREETRAATLDEGKTAVVEIALQKAPEGQAPSGAREGRRPGWSRPTGIALTAAGGVGLGIGAVTGILSLNKISAIKSSCGGRYCQAGDTEDQGSLSSAKALGKASTAGFIAGGVLAAAGVVLLVVHPDRAREPAAGGARPSSLAPRMQVSLGAGRFDLEGSF